MTQVLLEQTLDGPFNSAVWTAKFSNGAERRIEGKAASLIHLLLSANDYNLRDDISVLDLFDRESLIPGQRAFIEQYAKDNPANAEQVWEDWFQQHPQDRGKYGPGAE